MAKVILLSQFPLPYPKIGSWTTMYNNYLAQNHQIDYIICEQPQQSAANVLYKIVRPTLMLKIRRRLMKYYSIGFVDALEKILNENKGERFIIQLIDNFRIVPWINRLLIEKDIRSQCYIQVFYHGFTPFIDLNRYPRFYETIDELVLLTKDSYKAHKDFYMVFPCRISILNNGVDTNKFKKISLSEKEKLQVSHGFANKKIFIWCSQDRPKKGLSLILDVWKRVHAIHRDTVLMVIGANRDVEIDGVVFFGKIPNADLPRYYQMSDCYLFPTLCHEGFGLSLIEALNCGCYCIASNTGGVPEVLQYGKYGRLVDNPNFIAAWETAILNYLSGVEKPIVIDKPLYGIDQWILNLDEIIGSAKASLL